MRNFGKFYARRFPEQVYFCGLKQKLIFNKTKNTMKKFLTDNAYIIMGVLAAAAIYMWYAKKQLSNKIAEAENIEALRTSTGISKKENANA